MLKYLVRAKWFIPKERNTYQIVISNYTVVPVDGHQVFWLLLEITGDDGCRGCISCRYGSWPKTPRRNWAKGFPEALIAQVKSEEGDGILVDAFFAPGWQMILLEKTVGAEEWSCHRADCF